MDMNNEDKELQALLAENEALQKQEMQGDGMQFDQIKLAKQGTRALVKANKDEYIQGLSIGDFYLYKAKKVLGAALSVVPLQFVSLYTEHEVDGTGIKQISCGIWTYEDGQKCPECVGSFYNRQLPNGHVLTPEVWVVASVVGADVDEPVSIRYKATGIKIVKKWKEDVRRRGGSSATMIYSLTEESYANNKGNTWTDISFAYTGSFVEQDKSAAIAALKLSTDLRKAYSQGMMIAPHNLPAGTPVQATMIEDNTNDEDVPF